MAPFSRALQTRQIEPSLATQSDSFAALGSGPKRESRARRANTEIGQTAKRPSARLLFMERVTGVEPASSAWKAEVLPLNHTREGGRGDWIRTSDPLLPKQMRYQTAPRPGTPVKYRRAGPSRQTRKAGSPRIASASCACGLSQGPPPRRQCPWPPRESPPGERHGGYRPSAARGVRRRPSRHSHSRQVPCFNRRQKRSRAVWPGTLMML